MSETVQDATVLDRLRNAPTAAKVAIGLTATTALFLGGREIAHQIHDARHPLIHVGTTDEDVRTLATMLENSNSSAYDVEGTPSKTASRTLMQSVIRFQITHGIDGKNIGIVREGDDTWDALKDEQSGATPDDLPAVCYTYADAICVVTDQGSRSGNLYVMHEANEKFRIKDVGIGTEADPSDEGEFTVDPMRMYETGYFSRSAHDVAMPFAMFYNGGEAIHFSRLKAEKGTEYPGSAGCVTIGSLDAAETLYHYTEDVVGDGRTMHVVVAPE